MVKTPKMVNRKVKELRNKLAEQFKISIMNSKAVTRFIDAENKAGSRVLLAQHPRPSLISGHDRRYAERKQFSRPI